MSRFATVTTLLISLIATTIVAAPTNLTKRSYNFKEVISGNFPDPSVFLFGSSDWWAFGTTNHNGINVQVATSPDYNTWTVQTYDALPDAGPWAASVPNVWAPNVVINNWGFYVMYYSAASASNPAQHCIGVAVASSINGPYIPHSTPFACPIAQGGAIDASGFHDTDGSRYVVYKVDGGSIGHGGACSNGVAPIVPTPIMLQQVDSNDAFTPVGSPVQILTNIAADGSGVEAPALTKSGNTYVLFYSSNCYTTSAYTISYAMSTSLTSAFTRYGNLATTGTDGLTAPGGAHVNFDGTHMVFHANNGNGGRSMWDATISINTQTHTVTAN